MLLAPGPSGAWLPVQPVRTSGESQEQIDREFPQVHPPWRRVRAHLISQNSAVIEAQACSL